jgi:glutaredoxin-related protein
MDGYQDRALALLDEHQIRYSTFDVMADSDVREILKE